MFLFLIRRRYGKRERLVNEDDSDDRNRHFVVSILLKVDRSNVLCNLIKIK